MSGGSYNYLYSRDALSIRQHFDDLNAMHHRLRALGFEDAADETFAFDLELRKCEELLEAHKERLQDVWHAVEWLDSCDWDLAQVLKVIEEYREKVV